MDVVQARRPAVEESTRRALERELRATVTGDVWFDRATRAIYATDASNYRQVPLGIVCPADADDVVTALRICSAPPFRGRDARSGRGSRGLSLPTP